MIFYSDKSEKFTADIEVDGTSISNTKVRMVLELNDNKNRLYYGTINKNGKVEVKIPALNDLTESTGKAILEIIADSTYFTPWESEFEIKSSKTVKIKEAKFELENEVKVKLIEEKQNIVQQTSKTKSEFKENISEKSKTLVKSLLELYSKEDIKSRIKIKSMLEDKEFNTTTISWAKTVFEDHQTKKQKYVAIT